MSRGIFTKSLRLWLLPKKIRINNNNITIKIKNQLIRVVAWLTLFFIICFDRIRGKTKTSSFNFQKRQSQSHVKYAVTFFFVPTNSGCIHSVRFRQLPFCEKQLAYSREQWYNQIDDMQRQLEHHSAPASLTPFPCSGLFPAFAPARSGRNCSREFAISAPCASLQW